MAVCTDSPDIISYESYDSLDYSNISRKVQELVRACFATLGGHKELRLLVTGKTGEGKSTLINGILGGKVAVEGASSTRCTTKIIEYKAQIEDVPITVFDSPGLQDRTGNEDEYIADMKKKCQILSLVLYCTKMGNHRLKDEDQNAVEKLTEAFGHKFWKYAVIVLTFANKEDVERCDDRDEDEGPEPPFDDETAWKKLKRKRFEGRVKKWKDGFYKFLIEEVGVTRDIVERILVVPVGDHRKTRSIAEPYRLPDRDDWFIEFWKACSLRVREINLFFKINKSRISIDTPQSRQPPISQPHFTASSNDELPAVGEEVFADDDPTANEEDSPDVQDPTISVNDKKLAWIKDLELKIEELAEEAKEEMKKQMAEENRRTIEGQAKENEKAMEELVEDNGKLILQKLKHERQYTTDWDSKDKVRPTGESLRVGKPRAVARVILTNEEIASLDRKVVSLTGAVSCTYVGRHSLNEKRAVSHTGERSISLTGEQAIGLNEKRAVSERAVSHPRGRSVKKRTPGFNENRAIAVSHTGERSVSCTGKQAIFLNERRSVSHTGERSISLVTGEQAIGLNEKRAVSERAVSHPRGRSVKKRTPGFNEDRAIAVSHTGERLVSVTGEKDCDVIFEKRIHLNEGDVQQVIEESLYRKFGKGAVGLIKKCWKKITAPVEWFMSLF